MMNPSPSTDIDIPALSGGIARCAQDINGAFNTVAERLGDGLNLFEELKSNFGELSEKLTGADMDKTRDMLNSLAEELRAFGDALPAETAMLETMTNYDAKTSQTFAQLWEHLQLIAVLARSTRIEAASLTSYREEIGSFTGKIITLTTQAKESIDDSRRTYARLTALLTNALAQQRNFSSHYRASLEAVAGKLSSAVEVIGERAVKSTGFMEDAAQRARKLSSAVGGAIVSMQSGDNIRQRLEHVVTALNTIDGSSGDDVGFVVKHLQTRQLEAANELLRTEVRGIDRALAQLEKDSRAMVDLGRTLHSGEGEGANSFLDSLKADLAAASALIEKCIEARNSVNEATKSLSSMVDLFRETEAGLSETIQDILMIGTNAGLLAGRLGNSGRGLVVIANEVKAVASLIERDASPLGPLFANLQKSSRDLQQLHSGGFNQMGSLDKAIRTALERMKSDGAQLDAALRRLVTDSGDFGAIVGECRGRFDETSTSFDFVETARDQLGRRSQVTGFPTPTDPATLAGMLTERIFSTYTMVEERDIYQQVLEELGLDGWETDREPLLAAG
jgi:hypothetical protein